MMDDGAIKSLFLAFDTGDVETGGSGARWLLLNAQVPPHDIALLKSQITFVQGFKPDFNALNMAACKPTAVIVHEEFDGALLLLTRHRELNRVLITQALARTKVGGSIVISGARTDGVAPMFKELAQVVEIEGNLSKYHAKTFWFKRPVQNIALAQEAHALIDGRFEATAGMFSSGHVDPGSAFLMEHLPRDLKGRIADFGAGWGYLSVQTANSCSFVKSVALYEADHASLESAKANMTGLAPDMPATFHWQDLVSEKASGDYDTVIMNPPFHQGRAADPSIGNAIIRNAHNALHRGGKIYLVANRALPYEETLNASFFKSGELARNNYYKVLWATK